MKIFIAEHSEALRKRLVEQFSTISGLEIMGHSDCALKAIKSIQKLKPDIVLLNAGFIGESRGRGIDVLKKIRFANLPIKVIMVANGHYPQYKVKCIEEQADYIFESSDIEPIGNLLAAWCRKKK